MLGLHDYKNNENCKMSKSNVVSCLHMLNFVNLFRNNKRLNLGRIFYCIL